MPRKVLKLKATINPDFCKFELIDIKGIKPTKVNVAGFKSALRNPPFSIALRITNGNSRGRGVDLHMGYPRINLTVYNGKAIDSRLQAIQVRSYTTNSKEKRLYESYYRNSFLALRKGLENHFQDVDIDFEFDIIDNTKIRRGHNLYISYPAAGFMCIESAEASLYTSSYPSLKKYIKRCPEAFIVHSKSIVLVMLNKLDNKEIMKLITELSTIFEDCRVWQLPVINKEGASVSGITDFTFVITEDKSEEYKGKLERFKLGVHINKLVGIQSKGFSLTPCVGNIPTGVGQLYQRADDPFSVNTRHWKPTLHVTNYRTVLELPLFPVSIQNKEAALNVYKNFYIDGEHTKKHESLKKILESIRGFYLQLDRSKGFGYVDYSKVKINDLEISLKDFITQDKSKGNIVISTFTASDNKRFKIQGCFTLDETARDIIKDVNPFRTYVGLYSNVRRSLRVDLSSEEQIISEEEFKINLGVEGPVLFDVEFETDDFQKTYEAYSNLWDAITYKLGGRMEIIITDRENLELPKTKRCTPFDYVFSAGVEYETGLANLNVQMADSRTPKSVSGVVYGSCQDGGGVELKTVVMDNPNVFAYIGKFDALCKGIRESSFKPNLGASTHIHMSINPKKKESIPKGKKQQEINPTWYGDAMFRRTLIGNNWFALLNKYLLALSFLDAFNPGGRRVSRYGKGFRITTKNSEGKIPKLVFDDTRFTNFKGNQYKDVHSSTGRDSLLRTEVTGRDNKEYIHWEWRGTDACPSALFMGLKIEFMQAIARSAIQIALDGKQLDIWDPVVLDEYDDITKVTSVYDITDLVCRNKLKKAIKELKPWMSTYAYKGLTAWATYVNILREDTGTVPWFEEMEKILVTKIGVKYFLTDKDLGSLFKFCRKTKCYIPKDADIIKNRDKTKTELYSEVVPDDLLDHTVSGYTFGASSYSTNVCHKCGQSGRTYVKFKMGLCDSCRSAEAKLERWKLPQAKEFKPARNQANHTKELIEKIVTKPLRLT